MRVTNNMLISAMMQNVSHNYRRISELEQKLSTGKEIQRPSDDPSRVGTALRMRNNMGEIKRFKENIETATSWLETYDTTLGNVNDLLVRAKELAVYGGNGTMGQQSRDALAQEVDQLLDQMVILGNTEYEGRYIFAGFQTTAEPFTKVVAPGPPPVTTVNYSGDTGVMNWEIGPNMVMPVNITGQDVFVNNNIFQTLIDLSANLRSGNITAITTTDMQNIDNAIKSIQTYAADLGAKVNRLDMTKNRIEEQDVNFTRLLSETEDADMAEVIMKLKNEENVYRASLAAGARVIQPTLLDFLS